MEGITSTELLYCEAENYVSHHKTSLTFCFLWCYNDVIT